MTTPIEYSAGLKSPVQPHLALFAEGTAETPTDAGQWRISAIQLLNWGTYQGRHRIGIHRNGTAFVGGTGVGKSTFLDAVQTVLADASVRFNTAAQDGDVRANGRSFVTYIRGVRGQPVLRTTAGGVERYVEDCLRPDREVRSAVAVTWDNGLGETITACRAMRLPATGTTSSDVDHVLFWLHGDIDVLEVLNRTTTTRFTKTEFVKGLPDGARVFQNDRRGYISSLAPVIGLDADRNGKRDYEKIIKLLVKAASGKGVNTVDALFKQFALDESSIDHKVDEAINRFSHVKDIWSQITRDRDQIKMLAPVVARVTDHDAMVARQSVAQTLDENPPAVGTGGQVTGSVPSRLGGPVAAWFYERALPLLDRTVDEKKEQIRADSDTITDLAAEAKGLQNTLDALARDLHAAGGDKIGELEQERDRLEDALERLRTARERLSRHCDQVSHDLPADAAAFAELRAAASRKTETAAEQGRQAEEFQQQALKEQGVLEHELDQKRGELAHAMASDRAVQAILDQLRTEVADATGIVAEDLPFVSELVDVRDGEERWRTAVEHALGGFTRVMLVHAGEDRARVTDYLHRHDLRSRIAVQGVETSARHRLLDPVPDTVPHKVVFDEDSEFTPWLRQEIGNRYAATCVEDAEDARRHGGYTVTRSGLVRTRGDRWTKSARGTQYPIGFTNARYVEQLRAEADDLDRRLSRQKTAVAAADAEVKRLAAVHAAWTGIQEVAWKEVDVTSCQNSITELTRRIDALDSGEIQQLRQQQEQLREKRDGVVGTIGTRRSQLEDHEAELEDLYARKEEIPQIKDWPEVSDEQATMIGELYARAFPDSEVRADPRSMTDLGERTETLRRVIAAATWDGETERLRSVIQMGLNAFAGRWPDAVASLGTSFGSRHEYVRLHDHLVHDGLPQAQEEFDQYYASFTRRDLQDLLRTLEDEQKAVDERLRPVNRVLAQVAFGESGSSMRIERRKETPTEYREFVQRVQAVTQNAVGGDDEERDERFRKHLELMEWLASDSAQIARERSMALSLTRRTHFDAIVTDSSGEQRRYSGTESSSGGQGQELVSALLGAALRFQLDSADGRLVYAPIVMDEGFVKADQGVTTRAIETLQSLGFQAVMAVPEGKTEDAARAFGSIVSVAQQKSTKRSYACAITFDDAVAAERAAAEKTSGEEHARALGIEVEGGTA